MHTLLVLDRVKAGLQHTGELLEVCTHHEEKEAKCEGGSSQCSSLVAIMFCFRR